MSVSLFDLF